jgi:hypothetical protein
MMQIKQILCFYDKGVLQYFICLNLHINKSTFFLFLIKMFAVKKKNQEIDIKKRFYRSSVFFYLMFLI